MTTKRCTRCDEVKPLHEFHKDSRASDGRMSCCKPCNAARTRAWFKKNPAAYRRICFLRPRLKKYGLTIDQYEHLQLESNGRCSSCRGQFASPADEHIDHCHETGKVRGLLCRNCNLALGYLKDDSMRVTALLLYIGSHAG